VRAPILAANRAHKAVHYTTLLPSVRKHARKSHSALFAITVSNNLESTRGPHASVRVLWTRVSAHTHAIASTCACMTSSMLTNSCSVRCYL
jgi:hypothetical protein